MKWDCLFFCGRSGDVGRRVGFTSRSHCSVAAGRQSGKCDPSVSLAWSPLCSLRMGASPHRLPLLVIQFC